MLRLVVNGRAAVPLRGGHPWVYRDELIDPPAELPDGEEADVLDERGQFLGRGLTSGRSRIVCRIFVRKREAIDRDFFKKRISAAHEFRRNLNLPSARTDAFRLVFADGDRVPGLTVDRLGKYLVVQTPTSAMDRRKGLVVELLQELFQPAGICERNDMGVREMEGLPLLRTWLAGEATSDVEIRENGIVFRVDPLGAMKTGHFCDQRENRRLIEPIVRGRSVLDLFAYTGGFGLVAARAGASGVLTVDQSAEAIEAARANARANGLEDRIDHRAADVFEVLRELEAEKRRFEVVVLDPPAFAKSKVHLPNALKAYREVNAQAFALLPVGGHLLTCSCSYNVSRADFRKAVMQAAGQTRRLVRVVAEGGQGPDHPVLVNVPETEYLKALLAQVVERW